MFIALIILHIVVAISLVLIVLLQTGRGAELGAAFGGTGQANFGRTQSTFLSKVTTTMAIVFMTTSMTLAFLSSDRPAQSILSDVSAPVAQPAAEAPKPAQPADPAQSEEAPVQQPVLPQTQAPVPAGGTSNQ